MLTRTLYPDGSSVALTYTPAMKPESVVDANGTTTFVYDKGGKQQFRGVGAVREADLDLLLGQLVAQN